MQIAQQLANYSFGQADLLRRAMGKKEACRNGEAARTLYERLCKKWREQRKCQSAV